MRLVFLREDSRELHADERRTTGVALERFGEAVGIHSRRRDEPVGFGENADRSRRDHVRCDLDERRLADPPKMENGLGAGLKDGADLIEDA
jgi:hypothetical protein